MLSKTFALYNFGCRVNAAESNEIVRHMFKKGFSYTMTNPTIYIINTCAVTYDAEQDVLKHIRHVKRKFPKSKIVITGCAATYWSKYDKKKCFCDLSINNDEKRDLAKIIINTYFKNMNLEQKQNQFLYDIYKNSNRQLIKIQDGCQRFCTYCIVPYLRGLPKSKSKLQILNEIDTKENIKEIILTAINTEYYGIDYKYNLTDLIKYLIKNSTIQRISFGSIHPLSFNSEFFDIYKKRQTQERLVHFFHIPIQSGSNTVLDIMKRGYKIEEILTSINRIKSINKNALLASDIIVGFLGEEDDDFNKSYSFIKNAPICKLHVFRFSQRPNTAAYFLRKKYKEPSDIVKKNRSKALIELSNLKYKSFQKSLIGYTSQSLFLLQTKDKYRKALLDNQVPIYVNIKNADVGIIKNVSVVDYQNGELFGKIVH